MQALPFTSLNFHLNLYLLPFCHLLPAALHPPALKFPLLFSIVDCSGGAFDHLLVPISLVSSIRLFPPWPGKKAQVSCILKVKLKKKKMPPSKLSQPYIPFIHSSPTWGSRMVICGLASSEPPMKTQFPRSTNH